MDDNDDDYLYEEDRKNREEKRQAEENRNIFSDLVFSFTEVLLELHDEQPELFKPENGKELYLQACHLVGYILSEAESLLGCGEVEKAYEEACENL